MRFAGDEEVHLTALATLVLVDLSETSYLDSAGIAMIFRLVARLTWRRQELRLVVPADAPIRKVLELTKLGSVVLVRDVIIRNPDILGHSC